MKSKMTKQKNILILITSIIILLLIAFLFIKISSSIIRKQVYKEFECSFCENTIDKDDTIDAIGMRAYIDELSNKYFTKEKVIIETAKRFGLKTIKNPELREKIRLRLYYEINNNKTFDYPVIKILPEFTDLGLVSASKGIVIQDFEITNEGNTDLYITDMKTSCACLTVSIVYNGDEGPRLGRFSHSQGWEFILKPKQKAILRAYYDGRKVPWFRGHAQRWIEVTSNDPIHYIKVVGMDINQTG